jgi:hypothetical protein
MASARFVEKSGSMYPVPSEAFAIANRTPDAATWVQSISF